jgi:hypothetical protein
MSIASFFPDWLRERMRQPGSVLGTDALTWSEIIDGYSNDGAGLLYVLLTIAHGRRTFEADPRDVRALLRMTSERFGELVMQFVRARWIELEFGGDGATWTILRTPQGWA